jgi:cytochrome b subunit of formate dehydrogenase
MFQLISIIGFAVVFIGIACHLLISRPTFKDSPPKARPPRLLDILRMLVYLVALLCFLVLLLNGFYSSLVLAESITGYRVILQTTAGGAFTVCIAILAVMWAHNCRLDKNYCPWLTKLIGHRPKDAPAPQKYELAQKICFWLILLLALPLILSLMVSMLPLFGTDAQKCLFQFHRYSALLLALIAIIHTYLLIRTKLKR